MTEPSSPLTEASSDSLNELFARKPPFTGEELARMKAEFRRLRANWEKYEAGEGKAPKARKAKSVAPKTTVVDTDIFAEDPEGAPSV